MSSELNNGHPLEDLNTTPGEEGNEATFQRNTRQRILEVPDSRPAAMDTAPQSSSLMHTRNSSQSVQPSFWNWTTRLQSNAASASSSPAVHFHEGESSRQAEIRGRLAQNPTNASSHSATANFVRNIGSTSGSPQIPSQSWSPPTPLSLVEQYNQRLSEIYNSSIANSAGMQSTYHPPNPSTETIGVQDSYYAPLNLGAVAHGGQTSYGPLHPDAAAIIPEMVESAEALSTLPPAPHYTPVFIPIPMGSPNALPHPVQPVTGDQIRSRLVEEVHQALGIVHRNGAIHIGSIMILNNSIIYGAPALDYVDEEEEPDVHEDMRLDVDNMSYEDLLALEEHIGNVNTGLTEEYILAHLRRQRYKFFKLEITVGEEPCSICQEEYLNDEELGKLDCGHEFHFSCIKQWLVLKNTCPICKCMALST